MAAHPEDGGLWERCAASARVTLRSPTALHDEECPWENGGPVLPSLAPGDYEGTVTVTVRHIFEPPPWVIGPQRIAFFVPASYGTDDFAR